MKNNIIGPFETRTKYFHEGFIHDQEHGTIKPLGYTRLMLRTEHNNKWVRYNHNLVLPSIGLQEVLMAYWLDSHTKCITRGCGGTLDINIEDMDSGNTSYCKTCDRKYHFCDYHSFGHSVIVRNPEPMKELRSRTSRSEPIPFISRLCTNE